MLRLDLSGSIRPDRKLVPAWVGKVKAAATGKRKRRSHDFPPGCDHSLLGRLEINREDDDQRPARAHAVRLCESSVQTAIGKAGVIRPVVFEPPAERRSVELLRYWNAGHGKLDVVDPLIMLGTLELLGCHDDRLLLSGSGKLQRHVGFGLDKSDGAGFGCKLGWCGAREHPDFPDQMSLIVVPGLDRQPGP